MGNAEFLAEAIRGQLALQDALRSAYDSSRERLAELKQRRNEVGGDWDEVVRFREIDREIADAIRDHNADAIAVVRQAAELEGLLREYRATYAELLQNPSVIDELIAELQTARAQVESTHPHD